MFAKVIFGKLLLIIVMFFTLFVYFFYRFVSFLVSYFTCGCLFDEIKFHIITCMVNVVNVTQLMPACRAE